MKVARHSVAGEFCRDGVAAYFERKLTLYPDRGLTPMRNKIRIMTLMK